MLPFCDSPLLHSTYYAIKVMANKNRLPSFCHILTGSKVHDAYIIHSTANYGSKMLAKYCCLPSFCHTSVLVVSRCILAK